MSAIAKGPSLPATPPGWRSMPSAEDLTAAYPKKAQAAHVEGKATIECVVAVDGQLNSCKVVEEAPTGYGFGGAAVKLAARFQMDPAIRDGVPHASTARIPIVFKLPPRPHPEAFPASVLQAHPFLALGPFVAVVAIFALNDWIRGRRGAPRVKVWPAMIYALRFVATAWRRAPGPLAICVALSVARGVAIAAGAGKAAEIGLMFLTIIADMFAYGACYRAALQDCGPPELLRLGRFGFQVGAVERRVASLYLVAAAVTAGLLLVFGLGGAAVVGLVGRLAGETARDVVAVGVVGVCAALLFYGLLRFYTAPVAAALHGSSGYREGWRLGRAAIFSSLVAAAASLLALLVLIIAANAVAYLTAKGLGSALLPRRTLVLAVAPFVLPFSAGMTAWFYRRLSEQEPRAA